MKPTTFAAIFFGGVFIFMSVIEVIQELIKHKRLGVAAALSLMTIFSSGITCLFIALNNIINH